MDAERAARQIVQALRRGEALRILSLPALLLDRAHGLAPGLTVDLLGLVNRLLPADRPDGQQRERGHEIDQRLESDWLDRLLAWSHSAARRFNQFPAATAEAGARRE
jgi:hypothetical protein